MDNEDDAQRPVPADQQAVPAVPTASTPQDGPPAAARPGHGHHLHWPGRSPRGRVARQMARRHRRERIAGILIAVLGIAVLVVAIVALRHPKQTGTAAGSDTHVSSAAPTSSGKPSSGSSSSSRSPSGSSTNRVAGAKPLIVLNQTSTPDLARQAAGRFRSGGWHVTSIQEGYQNDVITTTAYYDPSIPGALRAANALRRQYATIHRVAERFAELPAGPVVVVLTTDYSST